MQIVMFYHSLVSDWNHGNAHFLRGVVRELQERGHEIDVYEPADAWSRSNLVRDHGSEPIERFHRAYPTLASNFYQLEDLDLESVVADADLVLVHEWNDPALVKAIGEMRRKHDFLLLFHDTHHRAVTAEHEISRYDLAEYDGVLAFGGVIRDLYIEKGWAANAWTWHEAADTRLFKPHVREREGDLVWVGNWGDDERTAELHEFLIEPVRELSLRATIHGVRYPEDALDVLRTSGIDYRGWIANFDVPEIFARYAVTVHVPRRPYVAALPGIPTIRVFEALACGIPLISAPWDDAEALFTPGRDFLVARNGEEMKRQLREVLHDRELAAAVAAHGLETIRARHTCAHRVEELLGIVESLRPGKLMEASA